MLLGGFMRYIFIFLFLVSSVYASKLTLDTLRNEKRTAFVIGNGDYDESPLEQANGNALKMQAFLEEYDFDTTYIEDASKREIIKGLREFNSAMKPHGIALFYFSGHMMQIREKNYLIPIDASIENDYHVLYEAIELDAILEKMNKMNNRLNIVIIDSAYKNPFGDRFRAKKKGLATLAKKDNMDIIFSVRPDSVVKPYPFIKKLLPILSVKGTSNKDALKTFSKRYKQVYSRISKQDFYFNIPNKLESAEEKLWFKTLKSHSIPAYTAYLKAYPKGKHVRQALLDQEALNKKAEEALKKEAQLKQESNRNKQAKLALLALQEEQAKETRIAAEKTAKIQAEELAKETTLLNAAAGEEKRLKRLTARFVEPVMVLIKAGDFMMGSDTKDENEKPQHKVTIENDFYMGKYEVTNVEYKEFLSDTKKRRMLPPNWTTDTQPVIGVSWDEAVEYAAWISDLTGKRYRLPTEQEWEYAARSNTTTDFYWNKEKAEDYAWIKINSENTTHPVGAKKPNPWGLFDVTGNVSEWCSNSYTPNYKLPAKTEDLRVIRGGSWFSTPAQSTLTHRESNTKDFTGYTTGFRLIREK